MFTIILRLTEFIRRAGASQSSGRLVCLDFLRAVAIILVLFRHNNMAALQSVPEGFGVVGFIRWITEIGWIGVDLFFVLSGFLIAGLIFGEFKARGCFDFRRFWTRRALKIFPLYYCYIGMVTVMILWRSIGTSVLYSLEFGRIY